MTDEDLQILKNYQEEFKKRCEEDIEKCWEIADKLDALNPKLPGSYTGFPSERIERHLYTLGIF